MQEAVLTWLTQHFSVCWGCRAFSHIHKGDRRKLDLTSNDLIHVGYEPESKSYRLWNPATRTITVSRDVRFDESTFPLRNADIHQLPPNDIDEPDDDGSLGTSIDNSHTPPDSSFEINSQPSLPLNPLSPLFPLPLLHLPAVQHV